MCRERHKSAQIRQEKLYLQRSLAVSRTETFSEWKITMLNFEKELAKYQPSLEVDEAEEAIYNNDLTDISDIIDKVLKEKKGRQV